MKRIAHQEAIKVFNKKVESKSWDGKTPTSTTVSSNGEVWYMFSDPSNATTIDSGSGETQYLGQKIQPSHIVLRMSMAYADNFDTFRIIIIQIRGLFVPSPSDVLQSVGNTRTPLSAYDRSVNDRFRVLYDRMVMTTSGGPSARCILARVPMRRLRQLAFSDTTGTPENGGIYLCVYSDSSNPTDPEFNAYWRIYFKDA